jgi:hypothetical protein
LSSCHLVKFGCGKSCVLQEPFEGEGSVRPSAWLLVPVGSSGCPPYTSGLSTWWSSRSLRGLNRGRPVLAEGFTLRCFQRLSRPHVGYPALPRAGQLAHQRCVPPSPLVLGRGPRKSPTPATDRDRPVSRRSKPSSRTAFIGEQPNPWELLHPQDAMSRHRGAKPPRRCERSGEISLLSPEYLLSVERRPFHPAPPDH